MKESKMQSMFKYYLELNPPIRFETYELKICKKTSIPFDSVADHQIEGLIRSSEGLYHKISDAPIFAGNKTRFTKSKPFDCMYMLGAKPYVVIMFYKPRKPKNTYIIAIDSFLHEIDIADRKSLTEDRAMAICEKHIILIPRPKKT